jgi:hypothetical protein
MHNDHTVYGVTAELAKEFHPQQWVNLYQLDQTNREQELHYLGRYRIKDLPISIEQADGFALEPLDEQGNVISVQQALDNLP